MSFEDLNAYNVHELMIRIYNMIDSKLNSLNKIIRSNNEIKSLSTPKPLFQLKRLLL
jgi:hypothetical protein